MTMSSPRRILIVGFGAAGLDAAISARKTDRNADVKAITLEDKPPYSRCGLPFVIGGEIQDFDRLLIFQSSFYKMMKINVKLKTKVTEVDVKSKTVRVEDGAGREENLQYDCLILATGAESNILNVKGVEKKGIYSMRTMRDASAILEASRSANRAVVIGGGEIALEAADALKKRGLHVTVMVRSRLLRIVLDEDMGQIVHKRVVESGVDLITGKVPEEYTGGEYVKGVVAQGEETKADLVVLAAGAHPNTDLAHKIGCQIGPTGGIVVSRRMETTVENVYSAGDCVEAYP